MKPSIGRIIQVFLRGNWAPGLICAVHSETCINAFVFADDRQAPERITSMVLQGQMGDKISDPTELCWRWPPRT
jgi:hypothetical protein